MKKMLAFALLSISLTKIFATWEPQPEYTKPVPTNRPSLESDEYQESKESNEFKKSKESDESMSWEWDISSSTKKLDLRGSIRRKFATTAALQHKKSNMVCSPISGLLPLGKLALGAKGTSLKELLTAVGVQSLSKLKKSFERLIRKLKNLSGLRLDIASRIYVDEKKRISSKFESSAKQVFRSSVEKVNFNNPTKAANTINDWVKRETKGMITKLVYPGDLSSSSSLVIVNAVYFSGKWLQQFDKVETGSFRHSLGVSRIPMMSITTYFQYYKSQGLAAQMVAIPYQNKKASLLIVLPDTREGLSALLSEIKVAPELLSKAIGKMSSRKVSLTMPKFKIESDINLSDLYTKLGITSIFSRRSELTGIVNKETLYVSKAVQKAVIQVNEYGTTASAGSALTMAKVSFQKPVEMTVGHPFLFYIMVEGQQLFAGVMASPDSTASSVLSPEVGSANPNANSARSLFYDLISKLF